MSCGAGCARRVAVSTGAGTCTNATRARPTPSQGLVAGRIRGPVATEGTSAHGPRTRGGRTPLVGELPGVGEAGAVVQGRVHEHVAGPEPPEILSNRCPGMAT